MPKNQMSYAEVLEARAQRGDMTHQKEFAVSIMKQKEQEAKKAVKKTTKRTTNVEKEAIKNELSR